ncbi:hypothetical protein [Nonomuraea sp. NPDC002799]
MIRSPLRTAGSLSPSRRPIQTLEDYLGWLDGVAAARQLPPKPRPTGHNPDLGAAYARVDDGRWLADCPAGCGSACELVAGEGRYWCTECGTGGTGQSAPLVWPARIEQLTANLESLPRTLQFWPCPPCTASQRAGRDLCVPCRHMQGQEVV